MRYWVLLPLVILASGCVTPQTTEREIARQIKAVEIAQDKVADWQAELQKRKEELEVLRIQRAQDQIIEESGQ